MHKKNLQYLLISLGSETAAKIMKTLPDSYHSKTLVTKSLISIIVKPEERDAIVNEFIE